MAEKAADALELLHAHPWDDTIPRLLRHASNKLRRRIWMGVLGGPAPKGIEPMDIVQAAVDRAMRRWDPDKQPDLFEYLKDAVDNLVYNLVHSFDNQRMAPEALLAKQHEDDSDGSAQAGMDKFQSQSITPEQAVLMKEQEKKAEEILFDFHKFLEDDPRLQKIVEAMLLDGFDKPAAIAEHLGIKINEIYACNKRMKHRFEAYRQSAGLVATNKKDEVGHA